MSNHNHNHNYSLEIISQHSEFKNKALKKYAIDNLDHVGAFGNEPFMVRFKNHSSSKVQVRLSIDGTDILTGKPASLDVDNNMWVVEAHGVLELKAFPETNFGGAQFLFTSADKSVALHTHGDLSSQGIIAAAVYTENHKPTFTYKSLADYTQPINPWRRETWEYGTYEQNYRYDTYTTCNTSKGILRGISNTTTGNSLGTPKDTDNSLSTSVAVGAGQQVEQQIIYTQGLIEPKLNQVVKVKFLWWNELKEKLASVKYVSSSVQSGFPASNHKIMDLGSTPRLGELEVKAKVSEELYSRF